MSQWELDTRGVLTDPEEFASMPIMKRLMDAIDAEDFSGLGEDVEALYALGFTIKNFDFTRTKTRMSPTVKDKPKAKRSAAK